MTFNEFLEGIADAIRFKKGTSEPIKPINFASEIRSIEGGTSGGDVETFKFTVNFPMCCHLVYESLADKQWYSIPYLNNDPNTTTTATLTAASIGQDFFLAFQNKLTYTVETNNCEVISNINGFGMIIIRINGEGSATIRVQA